ncbi:hypothetical protein [Azospirillum sp. B4]|uniref:hypothetical protein n=1 Tax=Azospirillum sp. B4 TaxID=95605 RepID=UPI0003457FCF|nr:hypothetical protein [Azospirillum sp. B4]
MDVTIRLDLEDWHAIETALGHAADAYVEGKHKLADEGQSGAAAAYAAQADRYRALGETIRRHIETNPKR